MNSEAKKITAREFRELIEKNPDWAATLTEKTHVMGTVMMGRSKIRCLSPLLEFHADQVGHPDMNFCQEDSEQAADFHQCRDLKVATGIFHGFVDFSQSGVETIDSSLEVHSRNEKIIRANFGGCEIIRCPERILKDSSNYIFYPKMKQKLLNELAARKELKQPEIEL